MILGEKMLGGEGLRDDAQACLDTDSDTAVTNLYFLLMQQFGFSRRYYSREQLYTFILALFDIYTIVQELSAVQMVMVLSEFVGLFTSCNGGWWLSWEGARSTCWRQVREPEVAWYQSKMVPS